MPAHEYRLRTPVLALRYSPVTADETLAFIVANAKCSRKLHYMGGERAPQVWINAKQAWAHLNLGDIVVADETGIRVLHPDQFNDLYEEVVVAD